jgi:hypothetical protein
VEVEHRVQRTWQTLLGARNIEAKVLLTDSRLAVVCKKYDKGGGWIGTPGMMLVANAISSVKAASRRKGKHLVAQIRHEYCAAITFETKTSWLTENTLRAVVITGEVGQQRGFRMNLVLGKKVGVEALAEEWLERAKRHLVANGSLTNEERGMVGAAVFTGSVAKQPGAKPVL